MLMNGTREPGCSEGRVLLVSSGRDEEPVGIAVGGPSLEVVMTPSGRDIFFMTVQGFWDAVTAVIETNTSALGHLRGWQAALRATPACIRPIRT
jgi:hypothetical protein